MKKLFKSSGFTIIEVVLVLAVAGLIFIVVFMTLPGMQISARDTTRKENISKLISELKGYQTNNRGALPSGTDVVSGKKVENNEISYKNAASTTWNGFYREYLGRDFVDPDGYNYSLTPVNCGAGDDEDCKDARITKLASSSFPYEIGHVDGNSSSLQYNILVVIGARCYGQKAVGTSNPRKVAVLYKLEGAGTYCENT